jgi:hypothetical protein
MTALSLLALFMYLRQTAALQAAARGAAARACKPNATCSSSR